MIRVEWVHQFAVHLPATLEPRAVLEDSIGAVARDVTRTWMARAPSPDDGADDDLRQPGVPEEMSMLLNRRALLRASGAGLLGAMTASRLAFAAAPTDNRFVFVFLRGGLDGLHALVPWADADYRRLRPGAGAGGATRCWISTGISACMRRWRR